MKDINKKKNPDFRSRNGKFRRESDLKILEAKREWEQTFDAMPDLIALLDKKYRITRINRAMADQLGMHPRDCIGLTCYECVHQTHTPPPDCPHTKTLQDGLCHSFDLYEDRLGGHYMVTTAPLFDSDGNITGSVHTARDISKRVLVEKELEKAREELEEKVKKKTVELKKTHKQLLHAAKLSAVGKLTSSLAHEFNNPLMGIMNILTELKKESLSKRGHKNIDLAMDAGNRMTYLIRDLQNFNRPTSGIIDSLDLHEAIDEMLRLSAKQLKSKRIQVIKKFSPGMVRIQAVSDQIKQVILNLLSNAIDAVSAGNGKISISTDVKKTLVTLSISDTGTGIPPSDLEKIFRPFFTTKSIDKGTGLGLTVSSGIINKHGGTIHVTSQPEKGATFTITLPISADKGKRLQRDSGCGAPDRNL